MFGIQCDRNEYASYFYCGMRFDRRYISNILWGAEHVRRGGLHSEGARNIQDGKGDKTGMFWARQLSKDGDVDSGYLQVGKGRF